MTVAAKKNWTLSICCNHPDNGQFTGMADAFEFERGGDRSIQLTGPDIKFEWNSSGRSFTVGKHVFPYRGNMAEWVGNWCWDQCVIEHDTVRQLAFLLKASRFTPDDGCVHLWRWWESMMPRRVQRSRAKGSKLPPATVSVTRPGRFGNPYPTEAQFREALELALRGELVPGGQVFDDRMQEIVRGLPKLRGFNLACFCRVGDPCHGDTLLEFANR